MFNRSIYFKSIILKATSYINDAIMTNNLQLIKYYICRYSIAIFLRNLCDAAKMSYKVAALPFLEHAIEFGFSIFCNSCNIDISNYIIIQCLLN